ncbi:MAG: hypothetical protein RMM53_09910 [Bacteroidia bacterium]|nr:hypothetical protein [Bacteroidia bacterium]
MKTKKLSAPTAALILATATATVLTATVTVLSAQPDGVRRPQKRARQNSAEQNQTPNPGETNIRISPAKIFVEAPDEKTGAVAKVDISPAKIFVEAPDEKLKDDKERKKDRRRKK